MNGLDRKRREKVCFQLLHQFDPLEIEWRTFCQKSKHNAFESFPIFFNLD